MRTAGAWCSARQPALWLALAVAGLVALGATSPATGQDDVPVGPSATLGTLDAARRAHLIAAPAAAAPAAAATGAAARAAAATAAAASRTPAATAAAAASAAADETVTLLAATPVATATPQASTGAAAASAQSASAPSAAAAATPTAAVQASTPAGGPRTFLINDGAAPVGWNPVPPQSPVSAAATPTPAAAVSVSAPAAPAPAADGAANASTEQVQNLEQDDEPPGTAEIPTIAEQQAIEGASQLSSYEANQQMPLNEPQLHSLQEFVNEGVNTSPLGVELQEGERRMHNGREVDGLLVVALQPGSPAERAGIQAGHRAAHDVVEGAAVAAALVFPPAVLAVPVIETMQLGENYDLIIGVDGNRVTNFMDFQDRMREARPGEVVYLNILRSGKRLQVPVEMPGPTASKLQP